MTDIDNAIESTEHMLKVLNAIKQRGLHPIRQQIVLGCFKDIIKAVGVPREKIIMFDRVVLANLDDIITVFANLSAGGIPASEIVAASKIDKSELMPPKSAETRSLIGEEQAWMD